MAIVSMKELLESGVHFGHLTRKWHPKMKRYIYGQRNGIHIIDLQHTLREYKKASGFVTEAVARGGKVLFVGTKRQAQDIIKEAASEVAMPYVTERWIGGTLTNFRTIQTRVQRMKELDRLETDPKFDMLTKKERLHLAKEREKLQKSLYGIRDMGRLPAAVFVVDIRREKNCIHEAKKLGIPVVALVDTNCDPDDADFPIPGNDDAVRAIQLFTTKMAEAVKEGVDLRQAREEEAAEEAAMAEKIAQDKGETEGESLDEEDVPEAKRLMARKKRSEDKAPVRKAPAKKREEEKTKKPSPRRAAAKSKKEAEEQSKSN
ncbi:MAG: 30S ribosomal protein S2 [Acidobacteriota bacterium]